MQSLDNKIHETVESINQLKISREFFLGFARDPQQFINKWLISQTRDLKVQTLLFLYRRYCCNPRKSNGFFRQWPMLLAIPRKSDVANSSNKVGPMKPFADTSTAKCNKSELNSNKLLVFVTIEKCPLNLRENISFLFFYYFFFFFSFLHDNGINFERDWWTDWICVKTSLIWKLLVRHLNFCPIHGFMEI